MLVARRRRASTPTKRRKKVVAARRAARLQFTAMVTGGRGMGGTLIYTTCGRIKSKHCLSYTSLQVIS
jgi:hypothetical protein